MVSNVNGEATSSFSHINANQSANRTTDAWKLNGRAVKSLTDHWSLGAKAGAARSTFLNQKLAMRIAPGVEYNVFPYRESTERSFTLQWTAGINRYAYDAVTIFGKTEDTQWDETFLAQLNLRQPFGSVGLTAEAGPPTKRSSRGNSSSRRPLDTSCRWASPIASARSITTSSIRASAAVRAADSSRSEAGRLASSPVRTAAGQTAVTTCSTISPRSSAFRAPTP